MATLGQLAFVFLKIGFLGFGGPFSLIAIMQKEVVERRKWLTPDDFTQCIGIGTVTPGPIFFAAAIFVGYRLRGLRGAAICGLGALLPGFALVVAAAALYVRIEQNPRVMIVLHGISAGVLGLFMSVVWKTGKATAKNFPDAAMMTAVFIALSFFKIDPIALIIVAGLIGAWLFRPPAAVPPKER